MDDVPGERGLHRALHRPVRHGVGHHEFSFIGDRRRRRPPASTVVAPGIAEALLATAIGLVAAIPAVLAYNKISTELGKYAARLEGFSSEFGALLSRQTDAASVARA